MTPCPPEPVEGSLSKGASRREPVEGSLSKGEEGVGEGPEQAGFQGRGTLTRTSLRRANPLPSREREKITDRRTYDTVHQRRRPRNPPPWKPPELRLGPKERSRDSPPLRACCCRSSPCQLSWPPPKSARFQPPPSWRSVALTRAAPGCFGASSAPPGALGPSMPRRVPAAPPRARRAHPPWPATLSARSVLSRASLLEPRATPEDA